MSNIIPADSEATSKDRSAAEYYDAWNLCKELASQLSRAMARTGDNEFAYIRPAGTDFPVLFGDARLAMPESIAQLPVDRVERLSERLSVALDEWNEQTKASFMAHVPPASSGRGFYYENTHRDKELPKGSEAVKRLGEILVEAGRIIRNEPELNVDRITINEHGVHTFHKVPGLRSINEEAL